MAARASRVVDWNGQDFPVGSYRASMAGKHLCSRSRPFRGFTYAIMGDLEFFSNQLGAPAPNAAKPCWMCDADRNEGGMQWNDFVRSRHPVHWMNRPRDPPFPFTHPIFKVWGVTSATLAVDAMHTVDGGVTSHVEGNTIFEVVFEQSDGMPAKAAMTKVWGRMKDIYDELGIREQKITCFSCRVTASPHATATTTPTAT